MKRKSIIILAALLAVTLILALAACGTRFTYFTVTFDSQGGSEVESASVMEGNPITRPTPPTRDGFNFTGWFTAAEATDNTLWNFGTDRVSSDMTLYAAWEADTNTEPTASLTYELEGEGYTVTGVGEEVAVIIPATHEGRPVTAIGESAFARRDITSVVIPDSVVTIGLNAFNNCSDLRAVMIGENSRLTSIANNAFSGNSSLTAFYFPRGLVTLGNSVFNNCGSIQQFAVASGNTAYSAENGHLVELSSHTLIRGGSSAVVPEGITAISPAAFRRGTLTRVQIPASVTTIGNYAFDDCANLTSIEVAASSLTFSSLDGVLYSKDMTELIKAPDGIAGEISLPATLIGLPMFAFDGLSQLTRVNIPQGALANIRNFAFRGTTLTIHYAGTEHEWSLITKASQWGGNALTVIFGA